MSNDKRLDNLVRQLEGRCHYFNGIMNECCDAGVSYRKLASIELGMALVLPCLPIKTFEQKRLDELKESIRECPKLQRTTHDEAVKEARDSIERSTIFLKAMNEAHAHAKAAGLKKGNGGTGEMPCPKGCGGLLRYSVASYNGHMHARCSTQDCLAWME
jgi:hypothetical protein